MQGEKPIKVALAEDHTITRKGLKEIINGFPGFEVIIDVPNGRMLLEALEKSEVVPDICLLDIQMNVMNGYDTAKILSRDWPYIRLMAVTMYKDEFSILKMIRNGVKGYISKDSDPEELHRALKSIYEKGIYHSELVANKLMHQFSSGAAARVDLVTDFDMDFLSYICTDLSIKEIADILKRSPRTLEKHCDNLYKKLQVKGRIGLAMFATKIGIIPFDGGK